MEGNDCTAACSPGLVDVNSVCVSCTSPCRTCSESQTNCTACVSNLTPEVYLSNFDCIETCPTYTYGDATTNLCTACVPPCEKCVSASECSSCLSGFFLLDSSCINPCDVGYLGVNRICQPCTNNCESCSLMVDNCLTCLPDFYFVSSTSDCVDTCPTGLYPNNISYTCTPCTAPCDTCSGLSTNCTSCLTDFLYDFDCVPECPDGFYEFSN